MKTSLYLVADAEVAADRERLGLLLDFGLEFDVGLLLDLGRTLRLALDPLRTRRSRACRFAHLTPALPLAVRAADACHAGAFCLAVRAWVA